MSRIKNKFHYTFGDSFHDFVVYHHGLAFLAIILVLAASIIRIVQLV